VGRPVNVADLVARARRGEPRAVARLISLVETDTAAGRAQLREVAAALAPHAGRAHVVGLTGPPGVGKSTSTSALVTALRRRGRRVGVLAVDPSSPFTGGALLGDRVRMAEHATDDGVFIRSMASRGHLGGLAWSTPQALRVLDAAGCDVVLIETVGVGQSEIEVVALADTTVVLLAPGMGDGVQAAKAGILEVADVLVVNKADRDGAARTVRDLEDALAMGADDAPAGWRRPVVSTVALRGEGLDELVAVLDAHRAWLDGSGERVRRRRARAAAEIEAVAVEQVRRRLGEVRATGALADRGRAAGGDRAGPAPSPLTARPPKPSVVGRTVGGVDAGGVGSGGGAGMDATTCGVCALAGATGGTLVGLGVRRPRRARRREPRSSRPRGAGRIWPGRRRGRRARRT
jgi:LAO/AO transport system kinase